MAKSKRSSKRSAKSQADNAWWEEAVEVPRADTPSSKKLRKTRRNYRIVVMASVFLFPLALLAILVLAGAPKEESKDYAGPPPTESVAITAVQTWIDKEPSPLPGGRVVAWNSYRKSALKTGNEAVAGVDRLETHTLTVSNKVGALFQTTVQIAVGKSIGEVVVSTPTLIPLAPAASGGEIMSSLTPWPTFESSTASDGAETAIKVWAEAFTSGDPASLLNAVGDERGGVSYVPLSGLTLDVNSYTIGEVAAIWGKDQNPNDTTQTPEQMLVSVSFEGTWAGQRIDLAQERPTFTYDLLIDKANTATPRVVAWGGTGSGAWLKPYANAVDGRVVSAPQTESTEPAVPGAEDDEALLEDEEEGAL